MKRMIRTLVVLPVVGLLVLAARSADSGDNRTMAVQGAVESTTTTPPGSPTTSVADVDAVKQGRGYDADPAEYLSEADRERLKQATVPVLLPTWLPNWTRNIPPTAFLVPNGGWMVVWQADYGSKNEAVERLGETVTLTVTGQTYQLRDAAFERAEAPEWPTRRGAARTYKWSHDNVDNCQTRGADGELLPDVEGVDSEAMLQFDADDPMQFFQVRLSPGPGCSRGMFLPVDMIAIADSLKPAP